VIRLSPIQTAQSFSIIPSSYASADWDGATISLIENGTNQTEADVTFSYAASANGNYIVITLTPTITLKEDQIYTLEATTSTDVLYRDLVYITSNTNKREVFSYPDIYTEDAPMDDEYIVL
jgi:hypothetical protein